MDCIAFLRQFQKGSATLEVDSEDIALANRIFTQVMGVTLDELKPATRALLKQIVGFCGAQNNRYFTRRAIRDTYGIDNATLHRHLKALVALDYVVESSAANGLKHHYDLVYEGDGETTEKFVLGLKDV